MLMWLLDVLCVHACCRLSLPLPLLAIQFCFVLPPWVILILNLILNYTRPKQPKQVGACTKNCYNASTGFWQVGLHLGPW